VADGIQKALAESLSRSGKSITEAMTNISNQSRILVEDIKGANEEALENVVQSQREGSDAVKGALGKIEEALAALNNSTQEIRDISVQTTGTLIVSAETNGQLKSAVVALKNEMTKIAGDLEKTSKNLAISMKALLEAGGGRDRPAEGALGSAPKVAASPRTVPLGRGRPESSRED
jgi:methyl-accepting chemotaxis protein